MPKNLFLVDYIRHAVPKRLNAEILHSASQETVPLTPQTVALLATSYGFVIIGGRG